MELSPPVTSFASIQIPKNRAGKFRWQRLPKYNADTTPIESIEMLWKGLSVYNNVSIAESMHLKNIVDPNVAALRKLAITGMDELEATMWRLRDYCEFELKKLDDRYSLEATTNYQN